MRRAGRAGSTLVEAVVAMAILVTAVVSLAGLASVAARTLVLTRDRALATMLASQKLEALSLAASSLAPSSPDALSRDEAGFVEYVDDTGAVLGAGITPRAIVFVRRWAVRPIGSAPALKLIEVAVSPCRRRPSGAHGGEDVAATVRLATVRSGVAW